MGLKPRPLQSHELKHAPEDAGRNRHGAEESRFMQHDGLDLHPVVDLGEGYAGNVSASCHREGRSRSVGRSGGGVGKGLGKGQR